MRNQVIEALTPEHGNKVIEYWQSQGADTDAFMGDNTSAQGDSYRYYGVIDGEFSSYSLDEVEAAGAEIIELPDVSRPVPTEIHETLTRIEAKLDQLLDGNKPKETDKVCSAKGFQAGDKVRVKSWKEIKRLTTEGIYGRRVFNDRSYLARAEKHACGKCGIIINLTPQNEYITVKGSNWEYLLPPHALEKI